MTHWRQHEIDFLARHKNDTGTLREIARKLQRWLPEKTVGAIEGRLVSIRRGHGLLEAYDHIGAPPSLVKPPTEREIAKLYGQRRYDDMRLKGCPI